jgi:hypothetical protein
MINASHIPLIVIEKPDLTLRSIIREISASTQKKSLKGHPFPLREYHLLA